VYFGMMFMCRPMYQGVLFETMGWPEITTTVFVADCDGSTAENRNREVVRVGSCKGKVPVGRQGQASKFNSTKKPYHTCYVSS